MDAVVENGRNAAIKHTGFIPSLVENEQDEAGRVDGTCPARPNSQARTGTMKIHFSLFS